MQTLSDLAWTDRPERRTALIASKLARYKVQIAALSETRVAEGHLTEQYTGNTFFWIEREHTERHQEGIGFAIKFNLFNMLVPRPKGIIDRLMTIHLPLHRRKFATPIRAYAPSMTNLDLVKDKILRGSEGHYLDRTQGRQAHHCQ